MVIVPFLNIFLEKKNENISWWFVIFQKATFYFINKFVNINKDWIIINEIITNFEGQLENWNKSARDL